MENIIFNIIPWFVFALLSAFFHATHYALIKKFLRHLDQYVLAAGSFLAAGIILLGVSFVKGFPDFGQGLFYAVLITGTLNIFAVILYYKAFKMTDLSLAAPMLSFSPLFLIATSFILLGEMPTAPGIGGILLIIVGSYILNGTDHMRLMDPLKEIFKNKGVFYMLVVAFIYSISANYDKLVVLSSDVIFGSATVFLFIGVSFLCISICKKHTLKEIHKDDIIRFLFPGILLALIAITANIAFTSQIVPYVISIKRLSVIFAVLYGGILFKERHILQRSIGALIMLAGAIILILF